MAEPVASALPAILRDMIAARRASAIANWLHRARWTFSDDGFTQLRRACAEGSWPLDPPDSVTGNPRLVLGLPWSIDSTQPEPFKLGAAHGPR